MSLTIEGHACQHDILYRVWRCIGDLNAAKVLRGHIDANELRRDFRRKGGRATRDSGALARATEAATKAKLKPLTIDGVTYPSRKAAAEALGVNRKTLYNRGYIS